MKRSLFWTIGILAAGLIIGYALGGLGRHAGPAENVSGEHAGMTGMAVGEEGQGGAHQKKVLYRCPMHPNYISDKPGKCPICGATLVPVEEGEETASGAVEGYGSLKVTPERQQWIGVKTGIVRRRQIQKIIRTVGLVDYDEKRIAKIHTRISGWIEDLFVDYTGKLVKKGEPLLTIYSPELVSTQEEYLLALKGRAELVSSPFSNVSLGAKTLLDATRQRLLLWDISEDQIQALQRTGKPQTTMTLHSPIEGFVLDKKAFEGKYVKPATDLYVIADLSVVWVYADIYEYEIPFVHVGQEARVSLSYMPGEEFVGKVDYIYPYMEEKTRTVKVRLVFDNPGWKLKPKMYGNVRIQADLGEQLAVPDDAVLDTGTRQIVFLYHEDGTFEPREVKLGYELEDSYIVLDGLAEGDRIMTSANFLIDSESKLRAATQAMASGHQHH
jgi:RND family efflux transporter MFP subunit